ncbi:MAG: hypothetical protein ABI597_00955 [Gammaproteobacteria bacterium]
MRNLKDPNDPNDQSKTREIPTREDPEKTYTPKDPSNAPSKHPEFEPNKNNPRNPKEDI